MPMSKPPMTRKFYQMHECDGFTARVTVELSAPASKMNGQYFEWAEDIADEIIAEAGPRTREVVQKMRGRR